MSHTYTTHGGISYMDAHALRAQLMAACPPIISRQEVGRITGGMVHPRTMANLDSAGQGPAGKVSMGRTRVGYLREPFIDWFVNRLEWLEK
jgi:hypothetical protein